MLYMFEAKKNIISERVKNAGGSQVFRTLCETQREVSQYSFLFRYVTLLSSLSSSILKRSRHGSILTLYDQ